MICTGQIVSNGRCRFPALKMDGFESRGARTIRLNDRVSSHPRMVAAMTARTTTDQVATQHKSPTEKENEDENAPSLPRQSNSDWHAGFG